MHSVFVSSILGFIFALAASSGFYGLRSTLEARQQKEDPNEEVLYLPSGKGLKFLSFGYSNALGSLLWFKTISYFGKHYRSDQEYRWLNHMCTLVQQLNPGEKAVVDFCSLMLSWEEDKPEEAIAILTRGIEAHPDYWRFRYLRGFNYLYFLKDEEKAEKDFVAAVSLPDADKFIINLATRMMASNRSPEAAVNFLVQMVGQSKNATERAALAHRLQEAIYDLQLTQLEDAVQTYRSWTGYFPQTAEELFAAGLTSSPAPRDPYGKPFQFDAQTGAVSSPTNLRRLSAKRKVSPGAGKHM